MDIDSLRRSLEYINENFNKQVKVYKSLVQDKVNPQLLGYHDDSKTEYRTNRFFFISTAHNLFDRDFLVNGISNIINQSTHPEETKIDIQSLLKISNRNIELFEKIYPLVFADVQDGTYNNDDFFFECSLVTNRDIYVMFDERMIDYSISKKDFENRYPSYSKKYYSVQQLYGYCLEFSYRANEKIGEWVNEKDRKRLKDELEISNLKREKLKFWLGVAAGALTASLGWLTFYFTVLRR